MIKIGIIGYGNLGKGVELAVSKQPDMEVFAIFTRRDPETVKTNGSKVYNYDTIKDYKDDIDVLVHCGSSEFDLREQTPKLAQDFNIVDSFDMHAIINEHIKTVDKVANANNKTALVSVGWDPGIFSMHKTIIDAILIDGETQSFWGPGISQGHSNVASKVDGVLMARNYSIPNQANIDAFRKHETIDTSQNHHKECYVVAEADANLEQIEADILNIEYYFKGSPTKIIFISEEEMKTNHSKWAQAGQVIRVAKTSDENKYTLDFKMELDSNPEFTSSVLTAYARAVYNMHTRKEYGAFTALDIRPRDMSSKDFDSLVKEML
ncbi:MAG: diaminopimelate dehydrogenase [Erysipelothrix sp.]|nr:diaminopimelate dehydrogenase [Erysipelothrix sp.]